MFRADRSSMVVWFSVSEGLVVTSAAVMTWCFSSATAWALYLVDQVGDEPGEVVLGQPVVQRWRPPHLEQSIPTTYIVVISRERSRSASGAPPGPRA
ncbi:hypothetical protein A8713_00920 [Streptomyces sp. SAT1]|nr:hypothetical protein A8713_00920 [Streptomyces sp. SAT1]